jgi:hypothetical protein
MKRFSYKILAVMPLLALLSTPPSAIMRKSNYRSIASVDEVSVSDIEVKNLETPEIVKEFPRSLLREPLKVPKLLAEDIKHEKIEIDKSFASLDEISVSDIEDKNLETPEIVKEFPRSLLREPLKVPKLLAEDIKHEKIEIDKSFASLDDLHFRAGYPRYEALVSKVDPKSITKDIALDKKKLDGKKEEFKKKLSKLQTDMKKEESDKKIVSDQRSQLESLVVDLLLIESSTDPETKKLVESSKSTLENLLGTLDSNEKLAALKTEEVRVAKADAKAEAKEEETKRTEKPETEKHVCDVQDKSSAFSKQMEQLMNDQRVITQLMMMNMIQNMQNQQQQQQQQPFQYPNQQAYQYNQPTTAGNWVYYPQGFQPQTPNIFAQQGGQQQQPQQQWGLQPQAQFQMPQIQMPQQQMMSQQMMPQQQIIPGTFQNGTSAGSSPLTFNLSNNMPVSGWI